MKPTMNCASPPSTLPMISLSIDDPPLCLPHA
jgi:hypothetical protein